MTDSLLATIFTRANVHFDGKAMSHSLQLADGSRKTVGVLLPSSMRFTPPETEVLQILEGRCRMRRVDTLDWTVCSAGDSIDLPQGLAVDIEIEATVHYLCHIA